VALSTVEAEYIATGSCCAQIFWLQQQLNDFGIILNNILQLADLFTKPLAKDRFNFLTNELGIICLNSYLQ